MKFLYLFLMLGALCNAHLNPLSTASQTTDSDNHSRFKADSKVYKTLYIGCGAIMLWLIIDLWVIMSDKKPILPYYLEPTDTIKKAEADRKAREKEQNKKAAKGELNKDKYTKM